MPRACKICQTILIAWVSFLFLLVGLAVSMQSSHHTYALDLEESDSITVTAEILIDDFKEEAIINLSTIEANPSVLPAGGTSLITITIRGEGGVPLEGEIVEIFVVAPGYPPGAITITQPTSPTNTDGVTYATVSANLPGLVTVRGIVTTYGYDIVIADTDNILFEPVVVPVMQAEPQFTAGYENTVYWTGNPLLEDFQLEVSRTPDFSDIVFTSGWLDATEYTVGDLEDGQIYYYRVRARNKYNVVGEWSNVVYSVQDASPPWSDIQEVDLDVDNEEFLITFQAADIGSGIDFVRVYVQRNGGEWVFLGQVSESPAGFSFEELADIYIITSGTYCFYTQAVDNVGNEELYNPAAKEGDCVNVEEEEEPKPPIEKIIEDVEDIVEHTWENVFEEIEDFRGHGSDVALTLISVSAGFSLISILTSIGLSLSGIPILISEFFIGIGSYFGFGGKRQPWGIVYDSVTKDPVSRAVVRLYKESVLEQTVVTDPQGTFSFTPDKGEYTLDVQRQGYNFPSSIIVTSTDGVRKNIYRGGKIIVWSDQEIDVNVPIDPIKVRLSKKYVSLAWNLFVSAIVFLTPIMQILGVLFALLCFYVLREPIYLFIIAVNAVLFISNLYIRSRTYDEWGVALDERGKPLPAVDIGLFDVVYDRLIEHRVTDDSGKFHFIVPGGEYYLRPMSPDYISTSEDPEKGVRVGKESDDVIIIAEKIKLRRVNRQGSSSKK